MLSFLLDVVLGRAETNKVLLLHLSHDIFEVDRFLLFTDLLLNFSFGCTTKQFFHLKHLCRRDLLFHLEILVKHQLDGILEHRELLLLEANDSIPQDRHCLSFGFRHRYYLLFLTGRVNPDIPIGSNYAADRIRMSLGSKELDNMIFHPSDKITINFQHEPI